MMLPVHFAWRLVKANLDPSGDHAGENWEESIASNRVGIGLSVSNVQAGP